MGRLFASSISARWRTLGIIGGAFAVSAIFIVVLWPFGSSSHGSALAVREATFRASVGPGQAIHVVTEHYARRPPGTGPTPDGIELAPERWTSESYVSLDEDGSVRREVSFNRRDDGSLVPTRAIVGQRATLFRPDGTIRQELDYPSPLPFDIGYIALREYVERLFPSTTTVESEGSGLTMLVSEITEPWDNPTLAAKAEFDGLDASRVLIRWEISEENGLLYLYQEIAVGSDGQTVVVVEDRVTKAEVVQAPHFLEAGRP